MRLTARDTQLAVVDDALSPEDFGAFWSYFDDLALAFRSMTGFQKVWRLSDGQVLSGAAHYGSKAPFGGPMDRLHQTVVALATQQFSDIVGVQGTDWEEVVLTPYVYPAGTKISWHNDNGYTGACIFYPHPEWDPHWGGELLVAKTPPDPPPAATGPANSFTRSAVVPILNAYGLGTYVSPLPNRLAFTAGSAWHSIGRVDSAAGDHVRCSVVAFFMKERVA